MRRRLLLIICAAAAAVTTLAAARSDASPLDLSVDHTPHEQLTIAPYFFAYNTPGLITSQLYFIYGLSDKLDVAIAPAGQLDTSPPAKASPYVQSAYFRWFLIPELALVLHANWQPGNYVSPGFDIHFIKYWTHWSLSINAFWHPTYDYVYKLTPGSAAAYIAPEYYFTPSFSIYLEIDPSVAWKTTAASDDLTKVTTTSATSVSIVPGLWFALPTARKQSISIGISTTFPATGLQAISAGLWYAVAINQPKS